MSIIAVKINKDTIDIASDSIMVINDFAQNRSTNKYTKLIETNNLIIGSAGTAQESSLLWVFCNTHKPEQATESSLISFFAEFSDWKNNKTGSSALENEYIIIVDKKVFSVYNFFVEEIFNYTAIGAGMYFALAALHLGHTVQKAVETACELSLYCEPPIKAITINK